MLLDLLLELDSTSLSAVVCVSLLVHINGRTGGTSPYDGVSGSPYSVEDPSPPIQTVNGAFPITTTAAGDMLLVSVTQCNSLFEPLCKSRFRMHCMCCTEWSQ